MAFLVAREEKVMMAEERILIDRQKVKSRKKYYFVKRIFDVVLSIGGLIILSPMMAVIAYKIKKEDGGPVFYKQIRVGKNGQPFEMADCKK